MPHHLTQRGNNRQPVFFTDADRRTCLALLQDRCLAAGPAIVDMGAYEFQGTSNLLGDLICDGTVGFADVDPFVLA